MDPPATDVELVPEKIENGKEGGPSFHCDLYDTEVVHKLAQVFLPGLATACVDNTTGDIFRSPGSVAAEIRKEMVDYLTQRSETFVAEHVVLEGGPEAEASDHPCDIISDFVDDFATLKRNLFSRVSGWLLSEKREDKIDDFVQEMEINGFWLMDRREAIAQVLLKNVDFKNSFHCGMTFNSLDELAEHVLHCSYRPMNCTNEGCTARFCARQMEKHDSVCPFKIIPCEQNCSDSIMRREMDRHCITVCPMKLVNCPFYAIGCQSGIPQCMIEQHRSDDLRSHVMCILQSVHKEASKEDLKQRIEQLEKSASARLVGARDARSLTNVVKDLDSKLGPVEATATKKVTEEGTKEVCVTGGASGTPLEATATKKVTEEGTEKAHAPEEAPMTRETLVLDTNHTPEEACVRDETCLAEESGPPEEAWVSEEVALPEKTPVPVPEEARALEKINPAQEVGVPDEALVPEEVPVTEKTPVPAAEEVGAQEKAPVAQETSVLGKVPAPEKTPVPAAEEAGAQEKAPVAQETSVLEEIPGPEKTPVPVPEEVSVQEKTHMAPEGPGPEKAQTL